MLSPFAQQVYDRIMRIPPERFNDEERAVLNILMRHFNDRKVTQLEIARSERWMGCHPKHEADIRSNKMETTTRQVRQIIRDLRVKWEVPIISDVKGYWIVNSQEEAQEYLSRLEIEAKAQIKSWIETSDAMERALNIHNLFFTNIAAEL